MPTFNIYSQRLNLPRRMPNGGPPRNLSQLPIPRWAKPPIRYNVSSGDSDSFASDSSGWDSDLESETLPITMYVSGTGAQKQAKQFQRAGLLGMWRQGRAIIHHEGEEEMRNPLFASDYMHPSLAFWVKNYYCKILGMMHLPRSPSLVHPCLPRQSPLIPPPLPPLQPPP